MLQASYIASAFFVIGAVLTFVIVLQFFVDTQEAGQTSRQTDWLEAAFAAFILVATGIGLLGVILATLGQYSLAALAAMVWGLAGLLTWYKWPFQKWTFKRLGRCEFLLLALLIGCAIVYFRPHEYVFGGVDAGSYINIGASIARTGKFVLQDDWTSILKSFETVTLRQQPPVFLTRWVQFFGWYIDDQPPVQLIPQFFPLHPILIAIGMNAFGLLGGFWVTPIWGVLSIAAVYLLARQLFDPIIGLLAAFLLAITPTQIFFARYPTAEPLTLVLVLTSLLAWQRLRDESGTKLVWGFLGGLALGAAFLTRIDLPVVALLMILGLFLQNRLGLWSRTWFMYTASFVLALAYAIVSALVINWPYTYNTYGIIWRLLSSSSAMIIVIGAGMVALPALIWGISNGRFGQIKSKIESVLTTKHIRFFLVLLIVLLSAYAYFLRPVLESTVTYENWLTGDPIPSLNRENWVRLGWYLTPLGLLLATAGLSIILWEQPLGRLGLFLTVGTLTTIQYVYNILNTPYHIYTMRRYVPIVIPVLIIYMAVAIVRLYNFKPIWPARLGSGLVTVGLVAGLIYQSRFVLPQRDLRGAIAQLTSFNNRLSSNALILIDDPAESLFADTIGVPLQFIFGHQIATIRETNEDLQPFLESMLAYATEHNLPVQLIAVDSISPEVREALALQPTEMFPIQVQMLMNTFDEFPSTLQTVYYGIEIYDVNGFQTQSASEGTASLEIDIGTLDAVFIKDGFYYKEPLSDMPSARWTAEEATLEIPLEDDEPVSIDLRAMIFRPEAAPVESVRVWLDGQLLGQFTPQDHWQTYSFQAQPSTEQGISMLTFKTVTFNPAKLKMNADSRDLGFLIDWVKITPE